MNTPLDFIFRCFSSGSSGNCYYLGTHEEGVLIDVGINARYILRELSQMHIAPEQLRGVLITHDHADHIRSVGVIGNKLNIPIYATKEVHAGIDRNYGVKEKIRGEKKYVTIGKPFMLAGMKINSFEVSHDASQCVGYVADYRGQRFMLVTDCGEPNETIANYLRSANHIVIEANHDEDILLKGSYPSFLKERILSPKGHQSNDTCGQLLSENYHQGMRNIFLCHLSEENNDPQVAYKTVCGYLQGLGVVPGRDVFMRVLEYAKSTPTYVLNDEIIHEK